MTFVEGKRGGAINLDGTDDVINCGTNSSILPDAWTLTAWVKITGVSSEPLFYFSSTSTTPSVALEWAGTGRPLLYAGTSNYAYFVSSAWTSLYNSSDWKFIAFSLTGVSINDISNAKMYINDSIIAQYSVIDSGDASTKTGCKIGGRSGDGFVQGQIDELRLYNRVLTISEIKAIYEGTK